MNKVTRSLASLYEAKGKNFSTGDKILIDGYEWMICSVDMDKINLINESGNRWSEPANHDDSCTEIPSSVVLSMFKDGFGKPTLLDGAPIKQQTLSVGMRVCPPNGGAWRVIAIGDEVTIMDESDGLCCLNLTKVADIMDISIEEAKRILPSPFHIWLIVE